MAEVVASTDSFRKLAKCRPHDGDRILEIGCCFGQCTVILAERAAEVLALDTSKECVQLTSQRLHEDQLGDRARSERLDVLAHPELLRILGSCDPPFTVVFADIGGNRELNHVVELLELLSQTMPMLSYVAVKSEALAETLGRAPLEGSRLTWWQELAQQVCRKKQAKRPMQRILQRPVRRTPDGTEICRFANYAECSKGEDCRYDHAHCHCCGAVGHYARDCLRVEETDALVGESTYSLCSPVAQRLYSALTAGGRQLPKNKAEATEAY
ncbi:cbiT [Symbiodinium pilosum]|uniref:CbiT protein n=1 Tax=Symbiodinium pilosum TaxID=2952 RepID=A0A812X3W9_SYMPI|nr:cbiT [Symbiodinium pilosum]